MPDRPSEMYRDAKPIVQEFDPGEWFYYRVQAAHVQQDETVDAIHIKPCPDTSSNRQRFSKPWYVLYPRSKYEGWAVFKFQQERLCKTVSSDVIGATVYTVGTEHDPRDNNYAHCETRVFRGEDRFLGDMNRDAKNKLRLALAKLLELEWPAGKPFPPAEIR